MSQGTKKYENLHLYTKGFYKFMLNKFECIVWKSDMTAMR